VQRLRKRDREKHAKGEKERHSKGKKDRHTKGKEEEKKTMIKKIGCKCCWGVRRFNCGIYVLDHQI